MSDYADNLRKSIINTGKKFTEMAEEVRRKQNEADREEILRMAREAGLVAASFCRWSAYSDDLERFANLVAAAEREVCAQLCEDEAEKWEGEDGPISTEARLCAINIRARGGNE